MDSKDPSIVVAAIAEISDHPIALGVSQPISGAEDGQEDDTDTTEETTNASI